MGEKDGDVNTQSFRPERDAINTGVPWTGVYKTTGVMFTNVGVLFIFMFTNVGVLYVPRRTQRLTTWYHGVSASEMREERGRVMGGV